MFFSGIQLIFLGVIGEYVGRIFAEVKERPLYLIAEEVGGEDRADVPSILSVGGWTLLSRITGFARDVVMAAVLGAGGLMDVFTVAFRLPNHFRAIFGEGAFNAAFVPAFARIRTQEGPEAAGLFQGRILSLLVLSQILLLALALAFTPPPWCGCWHRASRAIRRNSRSPSR